MSDKNIYITSTGTTITPYRRYQSKSLENMTSIRDLATKRRIETTGFRLDNIFTTHHLQKFLLENEFPKYQIHYTDISPFRLFPNDIKFGIIDSYQLTDIQYSVVQDILNDKKNNRWFVHLPQGFGKTFLSIYLVGRYRVNTLIMCYSKDILIQWRHKVNDYTDFDMSRVLTIDSGKLITDILENKKSVVDYNLFFATPGIFTSYAKKHGYDTINKLMTALGIGLKIYDEAHRNLGNMVKIDALSSVRNTIYLSGDYAQASAIKTRLFLRMFQDVRLIRPDASKLMDMRYTNAVIVEYDTHPSEIEKMSIIKKRGISIWDYMDYQIKKGTIIKVIDWILDNITNLHEKNRRILILTNKIEHCELFYDHISAIYTNYTVGRLHGELDQDTKNEAKDNAQIIIATYDSFSTGMDTANIKYVISTSLSNRVEDSQASGRARPLSDGENCLFWMLADVGFERTIEKLKERLLYLQSQKIKEVTRLVYSEEN